MNREQYMSQLISLLQDLPKEERLDALLYYRNYFDDAGTENEGKAIEDLGSPVEVAARIKENLRQESANHTTVNNPVQQYREPAASAYEQQSKQNTYGRQTADTQDRQSGKTGTDNKGLWIAIGILGFPIWFPLLITCFALAFSVIVVIAALGIAAVAMVIAFFGGSVAGIIIGIGRLFTVPSVGIWTIGEGLVLMALGILSIYLCSFLFKKAIPACARGISELLQKRPGKQSQGGRV